MPLLVGELAVRLELDSSAFSKALQAAEKELRDVAKNLKPEVYIDVKVKEQEGIRALKQELAQAQTTTVGLTGAFGGLGSSIRTALAVSVGNMLTQPLNALLGAFPSVIKGAADFEQGLSNVAAVAGGLTNDQLEALRAKALQIGADTSLSASQATQAFEALVSNGIKVDANFNKIADSTVALSEATGSDLTTAANVATDVIQNFAGAGENLQAVVNGITGVTVAGKFQINDYALALSNGGVATAGMGVSLTDFNVVIAATSSAFHSGQTAGTSFRTFIQALTPNTTAAKDAMKELGLITKDGANAFYDSQGKLKSQVEIFKILETSFQGVSEQQRAQYAQTIFGAEGANFLTAALRVGSQGLQKYADDIAKVSAADIAATRLNNFNGAVEQLKGSLDTAGITIGSLFLPSLTSIAQQATSAVNGLVTLINAVTGNEEAFNSLSPTMQAVASAIQTAIQYINDAANSLSSVFQSAISEIQSFFEGIIGSAFGWGNSAGGQFADGISSAISGIIDAIQSIGEAMAYWMAPGSPPKMYPNLDKDGTAVAQVYVDAFQDVDMSGLRSLGVGIANSLTSSFTSADLSSVRDFTGEVQNIFKSLVDSGTVSDKDAISSVLGTKESFTTALAEMRSVGSVSQESFSRIVDSSGSASNEVRALAQTFFSLEAASMRTAKAQNALSEAQNKLNSIQARFRAETQGIRDELDKLQKQQEAADIKSQIKEQEKLANAFGGDGSIQAAAQRKINELRLKGALIQKEIDFAPAISAAQQEINTAEVALSTAKEQERIEKERYDLVREQIKAQIEQNKLLKEQLDLSKPKSSGGGGGSNAPEIDKDKEAQDRYNFSLLDTDGKLANLKTQLAGVKEGSAKYYALLGQIDGLEKTKAKEQEKIAKDAQKIAEDNAKAERDYQFSIANTSGKLSILRGELANVEKGSAEYYKILGQIDSLEKSDQKKGKGGGGAPIVKKPEADPNATSPVKTITQTFAEMKLAAEQAREKVANFQAGLANAKKSLEEFLAPFQPIVDFIRNNFVPIMAGVATPAILALAGVIGTALVGAFATLLSPIALISIAVAALVLAWQTDFGGIREFTATIMENIGTIISNVLKAIQVFWDEHGTQVMTVVTTAFNTISSIVQTVMQIIGSIISNVTGKAADDTSVNFTALANVAYAIFNAVSTFIQDTLNIVLGVFQVILAAVNGDWSTFWTSLQSLCASFMKLILDLITNVLTIVASLFGVKTEDMQKFWANLGEKLQEATTAFTSFISKTVTEGLDGAKKLFEDAKTAISDAWDKLKELLPESTRTAIASVLSAIDKIIDTFAQKGAELGGSFIQGMIDGIGKGINGVIEAAKSMASNALTAAQEALDSHSPSKETMALGKDYTEGFVIGATKDMGMIDKLSGMMQSSLPVMQPATATAGIGTTISNYYSFTIDARGSTMDEKKFKDIIRTEVNSISERGTQRGRK